MLGQIYECNYKNQYYYIGKHDGDIFIDNYYGSGIIISNIIKKYGKDNITRTVLATYNNKNEANYLEIQYVSEARKKYGDKCINIADGGQGGNLGEIVNKKISIAVSGEKNGMYGRGLYGKSNGMYGKTHPNWNHSNYKPTDEIKKKISESHIGLKHTEAAKEKIRIARSKQVNLKLDNHLGKHWYTDGINNILCFEQNKPNNYYLGRTIKNTVK